MTLQLTIVSATGDALPPGTPLRVEIRDTSLEDAPSVLLQRVDAAVPRAGRSASVPVTVEIATVPDGATVWAHVDVDRDGRVSSGDFITMESYPVTQAPTQAMTIRVKRVT